MKNVLFFTISLMSAINLFAQNVGIGTNMPDASAKLDVVDANRGLLIPRVALTATNASGPVTSPATSLLVYNTATAGAAPNNVWPGFYYWDGAKWVRLDTGNGDWKLDGNTNGALRYIGTNDNYDFPIYTNGTEKMRVTVGGNVGIGTAAPNARLEVSGVAGTATEPQLRIFNPNNAVNETAGLRMRTSGWDVKLQTVQGVDWFQFTNSVGAVQHSIWSNRFYPGASSASGVNTGYISGNGTFIGVGTVAPTQRLHVAGGSILGDQAYAASTLDLAAAAAINIAQPATQVRITNVAGAQANAVTYSATAIEGQYLWISNTDNDAATFAGATIPSNTAMGFVYTGGAWRPVRALGAGDDWKLDGNNNGVLRYIGTNDNYDFPIRTNGTERMRVTTAGNVGIGTTSPGEKLQVDAGSIFVNGEGQGVIVDANGFKRVGFMKYPWYEAMLIGDASIPLPIRLGRWSGGTIKSPTIIYQDLVINSAGNVGIGTTVPGYKLHVVGDVFATGVVYCNSTALCSDQRWKTNIKPIQNALDNVLKIQGVTYHWKVDEYPDKHFSKDKQIGFIAQDIEKIYPQVVLTNKDGYKSIDYSKLTPILVEAIKDQQKIIQHLQEENFKIKQANLQLKEENNQIKAEMKLLNEKVDNLINSLSNHKKLVTTE